MRRRSFIGSLFALAFAPRVPLPAVASSPTLLQLSEWEFDQVVFNTAAVKHFQDAMLRRIFRDSLFPKLLMQQEIMAEFSPPPAPS
jgi:hypothetical protein